MNLSISNIAWEQKDDLRMYELMKNLNFTGLEIAPTRIFPTSPYTHLKEASFWAKNLANDYGLTVSSMQSIWYGRDERIWGTPNERRILVDYSKMAIDFSQIIGCKTIVFGCPKNRIIPKDGDLEIALSFFKELGDYAYERNVCIAIEANPPIYNTNFINTTSEALELIKNVDSDGIKLNLDVGTMIENHEAPSILHGYESYIQHVHISEPGLIKICKRHIHQELLSLLKAIKYSRFISIEMSTKYALTDIINTMNYIKRIFG